MLCILIKKQVKRRFLAKKAGFFRVFHIDYDLYSTSFGEICIYTLYYVKNDEKAIKKLKDLIPFNIYDKNSLIFPDYVKKVQILRTINLLKQKPEVSVYADFESLEKEEIISLLKNSSRLILSFEPERKEREEIYSLCGTLPDYSNNTAADICISSKLLPHITLPEELSSICPKEISPLLFASLLYRENGRLVI